MRIDAREAGLRLARYAEKDPETFAYRVFGAVFVLGLILGVMIGRAF